MKPTPIWCPGGCLKDLRKLAHLKITVSASGELMCLECHREAITRKLAGGTCMVTIQSKDGAS